MSKKFKFKMKHSKPIRKELGGFSPSEFKTLLRQQGHKISRTFFKESSISEYRNRKYRWRWWGDSYTKSTDFVIDISCINSDFDRWANSVDETILFEDYLRLIGKKKLKQQLHKNLSNEGSDKKTTKI